MFLSWENVRAYKLNISGVIRIQTVVISSDRNFPEKIHLENT
jgi:hypothetical protein